VEGDVRAAAFARSGIKIEGKHLTAAYAATDEVLNG
jgi:hypothetical protein